MYAIDNRSGQTKIIPITLAIAVVVGALSHYIFEGTDAVFAGAGVVIALGFLGNARAENERDRASGTRFSLAQLLEFFIAFALVIRGFPIVQSFSSFWELFPNAFVFAMFYVFKLVLAFSMTAGDGASSRQRIGSLLVAYSFLTAAVILVLDWYDDPSSFSVATMPFWLIAWFPIPTTTFCIDIRARSRSSLRYAVWRSVIEILFVCPLFCIFAAVLMMLVLMVTGIWPTGF